MTRRRGKEEEPGGRITAPSVPPAVSRAALLAAVLASLFLSACATSPPPKPAPVEPPRNVFLLLPNGGGQTNAISVAAGGSEQTLSTPGQAVNVPSGGPPGKPFSMSDAEVRTHFGAAIDALPPPPARFILYFPTDATELTSESVKEIELVVRAILARRSRDVSVVGHTDTLGDRDYNYRLSMNRARAVAAILKERGVDPSVMEIASHGKDNPLVPTGDQVPESRNRRVEVTVR